MTTETRSSRPATGAGVLARAAVLAVLAGVALGVLGVVIGGSPALMAALAGTALAVLVLFGGSLAVEVVSSAMPAASLLVALMTFLVQMVLMGLTFLVVSRSETIGRTLDTAWIGMAVLAVTLTWMVAHVVLTMRRRIPVYELPEGGR